MDENEVYRWIMEQKNSDKKQNEIETVNESILRVLIDDLQYLAVLFFDEKSCENCDKIIHELEKIGKKIQNGSELNFIEIFFLVFLKMMTHFNMEFILLNVIVWISLKNWT